MMVFASVKAPKKVMTFITAARNIPAMIPGIANRIAWLIIRTMTEDYGKPNALSIPSSYHL